MRSRAGWVRVRVRVRIRVRIRLRIKVRVRIRVRVRVRVRVRRARNENWTTSLAPKCNPNPDKYELLRYFRLDLTVILILRSMV